MRFIKLSDVELATLSDAHRNDKPFKFRNRCHCLILSHQGYAIAELTKTFDIHRVTVYAWFDLWERGASRLCTKVGTRASPEALARQSAAR